MNIINYEKIIILFIFFLIRIIDIVLMTKDMEKDIKYMKERLKDGRQKQSNNNV